MFALFIIDKTLDFLNEISIQLISYFTVLEALYSMPNVGAVASISMIDNDHLVVCIKRCKRSDTSIYGI